MQNDQLEQLKKVISSISDDKLIETFSKGALKLDDNQIKTVSFVFWLCYVAETDLNSIILQAWNMAQKATQFPNKEDVNKIIKDWGFDFDNLKYFSDKIKIYEKMFGQTARTKILWKINDIRNDLSHNRINSLTYNNESLTLRETKEKITIDYFETSSNIDFSKSKIWNDLTPEEQSKVKDIFNKFKQDNK